MNHHTAVVELEQVLEGCVSALKQELEGAARFVDFVGEGLLVPQLLDIEEALEDLSMNEGEFRFVGGPTFIFENGGLVEAFQAEKQPQCVPMIASNAQHTRAVAIVQLLILAGISPSLLEMYSIDYGRTGHSPTIKGVKTILRRGCSDHLALGAARGLYLMNLLGINVLQALEEGAFSSIFEDLHSDDDVHEAQTGSIPRSWAL